MKASEKKRGSQSFEGLQRINSPPASDTTTRVLFENVATLHFFRALLIDEERLAMDWVYDGPLDYHLDEFLLHVGPWFERLLRHHCALCGSLREALLHGRIKARVHHVGDVRASANDVRAEQRLRVAVEAFIDEEQENSAHVEHMNAEVIRCHIRTYIMKREDPSLPSRPRRRVSRRGFIRQWLDAGRAILSPWTGILREDVKEWLLSSPRGALYRMAAHTLLFLHRLWTHLPSQWLLNQAEKMERMEADHTVRAPNRTHIDAILQREEHQLQNPLALVCPIVDHPIRRWLMRRILIGAEDVSRHLWNKGALANIFTIHTARIFQIDEDETFLFFSDYDGSWTRYLHDFLTVGASGVVPIFAHLQHYPPTRRLFGLTPGFAKLFLDATRARQVPVQLWFSAWPKLSLHNRILNAKLREGLFAESMTQEQAERWLREVRL